MNNHDDDLPPELEELGKRLAADRPVAGDDTLKRVMTRAQGARRARRSWLLWSPSAPRMPVLTLAFGAAAVIAVAGLAGLGAFKEKPGTISDVTVVQYGVCGSGTNLVEIDVASVLAGNVLVAAENSAQLKALLLAQLRIDEPSLPTLVEIRIIRADVVVKSVLPLRVVIRAEICVTLL